MSADMGKITWISTLQHPAFRAYRNACATLGKCGHWFDDDTMRSLRSRLGACRCLADGRVLFVTSERCRFEGSPRRWTVRVVVPDTGSVEYVSKFQEYASASGANRRMNIEADRGTVEQAQAEEEAQSQSQSQSQSQWQLKWNGRGQG